MYTTSILEDPVYDCRIIGMAKKRLEESVIQNPYSPSTIAKIHQNGWARWLAKDGPATSAGGGQVHGWRLLETARRHR